MTNRKKVGNSFVVDHGKVWPAKSRMEVNLPPPLVWLVVDACELLVDEP